MDIREFVDIGLLENVMEEWSIATGMATIAMDANNEYLTGEIGFTEFCTKYTRGSGEGLRRCIRSDACNQGVYYCHAGLMDFSVDICLDDGTYLGKVIGGQILPKQPDLESFRRLATEIGVDEEEYLRALSEIEIRSEDAIRASASLLGKVVNFLVNAEYVKKKQEKIIRRMEKEIQRDPLTGAYNKSAMQSVVEHKIRNRIPFLLMIADVDGFKDINDTYGHLTGDAVLKKLTEETKKLFRSTDIVGRFGGDEFYFIVERGVNGTAEAERLGERICEAVRTMRIDGLDRCVTVSVGIAAWPEQGDDCGTLFRKADKALYSAKNKGKNRCFQYG